MLNLTLDEQTEISNMIISLLNGWGVSSTDQVTILAMPENIRPRAMRRYESLPFPDEPQIWERVEHLAGIADALRTMYPLYPQMSAIWMNKANNRFKNRTPLVSMLEDGLDGIIAVRAHLDCTFDWEVNGS